MTAILYKPNLDDVCQEGATTSEALTLNDTLTVNKNSASVAPFVANNDATLGPCMSFRTQDNEYLTARVQNVGVVFAGLIGSFPSGVTWNGFLNSALTGGWTVDASSNFTMFGGGSLRLTGASVTQGLFLDTSNNGALINGTLRTNYSNNSGILDLPDPGSSTHELTANGITQTLTNKTVNYDSNTLQDLPGQYVCHHGLLRNGGDFYFMGNGANAYSPLKDITLKKLTLYGSVTTALGGGTIVATVYKGSEAAGNECFSVSQSIASTGTFKVTDLTVNNAGKDSITTSDTLFVKVDLSAGTSTVDDIGLVLDFSYD